MIVPTDGTPVVTDAPVVTKKKKEKQCELRGIALYKEKGEGVEVDVELTL